MLQTRATTTQKRIDSGKELPQDIAIVAPRTKKPRADGAGSSRKECRGKPGASELCQLNLDVLFLVRTYPLLYFRLSADRRGGATSWPNTSTL